jgi:3-deoxy-D-manno-octulosonic-acid transferase
MLGLYRLATYLARPMISWYLNRRMARGKEDPQRLCERKGVASLPRPAGPLIWLHGASVGEAQALLPLIHRLAELTPASFLFTTGTVTSAKLLTDRLPPRAVHQYIPVDHPPWVERFLDHWQPDLALWSESDFWPNLLAVAHGRGIPLVLIQGRISPRSFARWSKIPGIIGQMLANFDLCLAQTPTDGERLKRLGAPQVRTPGNLKLAVPPLPCDEEELRRFRAMLVGRPVWLAASTHPGEEIIAAKAHLALRKSHPGLLTIIVPRHPPRTTQVAAEIAAMGLSVARRSLDQTPQTITDIYVVDTIGELGLFFRLASLVFMGKSLTAEGGQNPFEPARLGATVIFGPRMSNFPDMTRAMIAAGAGVQIADADDLTRTLDRLLGDASALEAGSQAALAWSQGEAKVLDHVIGELAPYLDKVAASPEIKDRHARP